jgi:hypothetical protein
MKNEFKFEDGKKVTIDISNINWNEWRGLIRGTLLDEDAVIAKVLGVDDKELTKIFEHPQPEVRALFKSIIEAGRNPLDDPNSASESTSE